MSLLCLAVIGKDNEPLYLRDVSAGSDKPTESDEEDIFGFAATSDSPNDSLSLRQEFMFHAAMDRLEEIVGRHPGRKWRNPRSPGADSSWIGLLCQMEGARIYGYITTTSIKFLGMVQDSPDLVPPSREADLRAMFSEVHDLYVQYTLNPFSQLGEKINSKKFDDGLQSCVATFDSKPDPPGE